MQHFTFDTGPIQRIAVTSSEQTTNRTIELPLVVPPTEPPIRVNTTWRLIRPDVAYPELLISTGCQCIISSDALAEVPSVIQFHTNLGSSGRFTPLFAKHRRVDPDPILDTVYRDPHGRNEVLFPPGAPFVGTQLPNPRHFSKWALSYAYLGESEELVSFWLDARGGRRFNFVLTSREFADCMSGWETGPCVGTGLASIPLTDAARPCLIARSPSQVGKILSFKTVPVRQIRVAALPNTLVELPLTLGLRQYNRLLCVDGRDGAHREVWCDNESLFVSHGWNTLLVLADAVVRIVSPSWDTIAVMCHQAMRAEDRFNLVRKLDYYTMEALFGKSDPYATGADPGNPPPVDLPSPTVGTCLHGTFYWYDDRSFPTFVPDYPVRGWNTWVRGYSLYNGGGSWGEVIARVFHAYPGATTKFRGVAVVVCSDNENVEFNKSLGLYSYRSVRNMWRNSGRYYRPEWSGMYPGLVCDNNSPGGHAFAKQAAELLNYAPNGVPRDRRKQEYPEHSNAWDYTARSVNVPKEAPRKSQLRYYSTGYTLGRVAVLDTMGKVRDIITGHAWDKCPFAHHVLAPDEGGKPHFWPHGVRGISNVGVSVVYHSGFWAAVLAAILPDGPEVHYGIDGWNMVRRAVVFNAAMGTFELPARRVLNKLYWADNRTYGGSGYAAEDMDNGVSSFSLPPDDDAFHKVYEWPSQWVTEDGSMVAPGVLKKLEGRARRYLRFRELPPFEWVGFSDDEVVDGPAFPGDDSDDEMGGE